MPLTPYSLWLWQNTTDQHNDVISWCSIERYGTFDATLACATKYLTPAFMNQCRSGVASISLQKLVGKEMANTIVDWLAERTSDEYLQIHFLNNLPDQWQALPLEWSQYQGRALHHRLQVIRYAPLPKKALGRSLGKDVTLFNLWPKEEYDKNFFNALTHHVEEETGFKGCIEEVSKSKRCSYHLREKDVSAQSMLCIISHGNENSIEAPLCCEKRKPWQLPSTHLPPLVVLVACGGEQGYLKDYALKLLNDTPVLHHGTEMAYGAATVLVAQDELNASNADTFIKQFIVKWLKGESADSILYQLQQEGDSEYAAMRMQIFGQSNLSRDRSNEVSQPAIPLRWNELKLAAVHNDDALVVLLDVLTQHNLVKYSSAESLAEKLYQALGYSHNSPDEQRELLYDRLNRVYECCDSLTKAWLSGFLMARSEIYEHDNMARYEQQVFKYETVDLPDYVDSRIPFFIAHAKYRERNHAKATQAFVASFNSVINNKRNCELEYQLSGLAVNILIDMSFTDIAKYFSSYTASCIEKLLINDGEQSAFQNFMHLDRMARLEVRIGAPNGSSEAGLKRCIRTLDTKRYQAIHIFEDHDRGNRELATLLIMSSWLNKPNTTYITKALEVLADVERISEIVYNKKGNIVELYLLKGLAHWAWRQEDQQATNLLGQYTPLFFDLCYSPDKQDSGPLGSIIACMRLMGKDNEELQDAWDAISEKMHRQFHYFELTMFFALLGEEEKSVENYRAFKSQQKAVLHHLQQLDTNVLGEKVNDLLQQTENKLYHHYPLNTDGTRFSSELEDMKQYGLIPF